MALDAITATSAPSPTTQTTGQAQLDLGKDAFMKMMLESLRQQDPSQAADNKEFVQQLSQMTTLEQITNMAKATASLATEQRSARAVGMIGKTVGYLGADGVRTEGLVESVDTSHGNPLLKVNNSLVDVGSVTDVR